MRPTFSILCFTVLSGIGYGAWFLFGLGLAVGVLCGPAAPAEPLDAGIMLRLCRFAFFHGIGFVVALIFVVAGLLCSLGHLGRPGRAWRALSQWRSSWLSREGVAAMLTFVPVAILAVQQAAVTYDQWSRPAAGIVEPRWWNVGAWDAIWLPLLGASIAIGSAATVFCTGNIYASLKPIRAWHDRHVVPAYLLLGLYGGALLLWASGRIGGVLLLDDRRLLMAGAIALAAGGFWLKLRYWRSIDAQAPMSAGHATGLETLGDVRSFEQPHTEENYLTHEMGFVLARKHARRLRTITLAAAFVLPALLAALALLLPRAEAPAAGLALASGLIGLFAERWLFFAQARHTVIAYYGR
jgi:DMSO reductase anchor subunit